MRTVPAKLRNALLLLLLTWAGLELTLQVAHFAFFAEPELAEADAADGRFRVLCIGESTTVGYPRGRGSPDSYPSILQRRLEEEFPDLEFQVVNRGLNAVTSSRIAAKLPAWLERYRPHAVVAMLGANDVFYETAAYQSVLPVRLRLALQNLRTYRLAGLLWEQLRRLRAQDEEEAPQLDPGTYRRILGVYQEASALYEKDDLGAARSRFEELRRLVEAQQTAAPAGGDGTSVSRLPGLLLGPFHESASFLAKIHARQGRPDEAVRVYREAIAAEPELPILHLELANLLGLLGDASGARRQREEGAALLDRYVLRETQANYRRIRALSSAAGATLVATQYPMRDVDNLKVLFDDDAGVRFVDNGASFLDAVERSAYRSYFSDRFAGDFGHLTPRGNALLVENLLDQALRERVVQWAAARTEERGG